MFTVVQRFRSDLGLYVHLHCLATDGAFEEHGAEVRFLPAPAPTSERMTAVLARVHKTTGAAENDDLDLDPALAACVQLGLAGPHLASPPEPTARQALTDTPSSPGPRRLGWAKLLARVFAIEPLKAAGSAAPGVPREHKLTTLRRGVYAAHGSP